MRRAAVTSPVPVYLARNAQIDVCAHLRLSLAEAERVVVNSPIVRYLELRGHLLRLTAVATPVTVTADKPVPAVTTMSVYTPPDYDSWTHKQLMAQAKEYAIKLPKNPRKAWLVSALRTRGEGIWQAGNQK